MPALPFDIANFNLTQFAAIYPDLMGSVPKIVPYQYKDANGNLQTVNYDSRGKLQANLLADVTNPIMSLMERTYYVDVVNGLDTNTGSFTSKFKTIKKAVDSAPVGSRVTVNMTVNQIVDIDYIVLFSGKSVVLYGNGSTLVQKPLATDLSEAGRFVCTKANGFISFNNFLEYRTLEALTPEMVAAGYGAGEHVLTFVTNIWGNMTVVFDGLPTGSVGRSSIQLNKTNLITVYVGISSASLLFRGVDFYQNDVNTYVVANSTPIQIAIRVVGVELSKIMRDYISPSALVYRGGALSGELPMNISANFNISKA